MTDKDTDAYRGEISIDDLQALLQGKSLTEMLPPQPSMATSEANEAAQTSQPDLTETASVAPVTTEQALNTELDDVIEVAIAKAEAKPIEKGIKVTEVEDTFDYLNHRVRGETKVVRVVDEELLKQANEAKKRTQATEAQRRTEKVSASANSRMLRGTMWMTIGSMTSRLLGAIYIIPWLMMIGHAYTNQANSLYAQGYQIYAVFLLIATAGLPNVLARLVAEYSERQQFGRVRSVFRQSLVLGITMGLIAAGLLYVLSGILAQGNANVVPVLQSLAAAVLIIPVLSMLRGYVQGFEFMGLSALSQFIEQLVRVIYMLAMTAWIMLGQHGDWIDAVVQSTFAAFWGALAGILVLLLGIWLRRGYFESQYVLSGALHEESGSVLLKMVRQSLPIILAGSAISLVQVLDQYTFFHIMQQLTKFSYSAIDQMFAQFSFNANKLIMLTVSIAVGMAETALPMLARAKTNGNPYEIGDQIAYALKLLAFVMIPASLGMAAVARPLYITFYGAVDVTNGTLILQYSAYVGVVFGAYMVVLAIYQGLGRLRETLWILLIVLVVKSMAQVPMTLWLAGMGPLVSTLLGFIAGLIFAVVRLTRSYPIDWLSLQRTLVMVMFWSLVMYAVVTPIATTGGYFTADTRMQQFILLMITAAIGGAIYGVAVLKSTLGVEMLGERATRLAAKLHLKSAIDRS
ncbi:putative polysaccharide biosynthesis protein [Weissella soli]|uniref:O-antigen/teichoic acid export membrane protein n=2 Tax=Weissella soli TaxID=155866 RepID=A0A288Q5L4_9LACO|nr:polysaccharide biosynthesis protein [Weissella soli]AOT55979.1 putative cell division protein YtgP [Weissella soli]NKY83877.1 polysaccharide biosynthesis protein [Weissella soli]RDL01583.1 O-antigen/teichoic acid export membrane protein [Weissella soli]GEN93792.1 transporter [Weissella soli]